MQAAGLQTVNGKPHYGFRLGGNGGSSRIKVIVTLRLLQSDGSSGNSGKVSALPDTANTWLGGKPSRSRNLPDRIGTIGRKSKAPYSLRDGTKPAACGRRLRLAAALP